MIILGRICTSILFLLLIPLIPWWLWIVFVIASAFWWHKYYEMIFIGCIYDIVVGVEASWWFPVMITLAIALVIVEISKTRLVFYS